MHRQTFISRSRSDSRPQPSRAVRRIAAAGIALAGTLPLATAAPAQGIGYTLTPAASGIAWDDGLGLRNKALYGGALSIDFERWLSLQGYFMTNNGIETAVNRLDLDDDIAAGLTDRSLRVRSYGANLRFPIAIGDVAPYLTAGGGIVDFRPDGGERTRQVALNLGGGVRVSLGGASYLDLFAHDAMFRVNRFSFFEPSDGMSPADPGAEELRHNLVFGGGIGLPFGASRTGFTGPTRRIGWGLSGASFALEPTAGQMRFESDMLPNQDLAGVRAGLDMGRFVGLRGFYWRGVTDNFTNTSPVQSWGGEAQLRLNASTGISPFLLLGGAQLDFERDFRNTANEAVSDKTALILGGGLAIPLTERLALNIAARDYIFSESSALENVAQPSELTHNLMYTAGLRFSLGGREGSDAARARSARQARLVRDLMRERVVRDSLEQVLAQRAETDSVARIRAQRIMRDSLERVLAEREEPAPRQSERVTPAADARDRSVTRAAPTDTYVSGRDVTLPVPAQGELYVRYGPEPERAVTPPDGRTTRGEMVRPTPSREVERAAFDDQLRDVVRQAVRAELGERSPSQLGAAHDERTDRAKRMGNVAPQTPRSEPAQRDARPSERTRIPLTPEPPLRTSGGEVDRTPRIERIPVRKDAVRDTMAARESSARPMVERDADVIREIRTEVRALLDSVRLEVRDVRSERGPASPSSEAAAAQLEQRIIDRVDSVLRERQREQRKYDERVRADRERQLQSLPAQPGADVFPRQQRSLPLVSYTGASVTDGAQALLGARLDMGPVGGYEYLRFVPEVALGWGSGARSVMAAGNVQMRFPTLRFGNFPAFTPQAGLGAGLLHFNQEVSGRDGLDGVLNLGYGAAFDLWRGSSGRAAPTLVVEHQGVDLFSLNRLIAGLRWRF